MSALPNSQPKTVEELVELEAATERRYEIVDGEFEEILVSVNGGFTSNRFGRFLDEYTERTGTGRAYGSDTMFNLPRSTRRADASVILGERVPQDDSAAFEGAPDVVVEVVSPSDRWYSVRDKVQEWLDSGARVVWLATPNSREVTVYRRGQSAKVLGADDVLDGDDVLPSFSVQVGRFFPPIS